MEQSDILIRIRRELTPIETIQIEFQPRIEAFNDNNWNTNYSMFSNLKKEEEEEAKYVNVNVNDE